MYEKIVLIGELRSGGKWLKSLFDPSHYMDLREFLSPLPQNGLTPEGHKSHVHAGHKLVDILVPILQYSNIDQRLVSAIHDVLVSLEISNNGVMNSRFSNLEICDLVIKTMKQLNKGSIIKLLPYLAYDSEYSQDMREFIDHSDVCIKFYRKNILNLYISHMKSLISGCWSNKESQQNKVNKNLIQIIWDPDHYNKYYHNMVSSFYSLLKNHNNTTNTIMVSYEEMHESGMNENQKLELIRGLINTVAPHIRIMPNDVLHSETKESKILDIQDNFTNKEDFLISQSKIQIYLPKTVY
jgi:hypothetical protein